MRMNLTRATDTAPCYKCRLVYETGSIIGVIRIGNRVLTAHPPCWLDIGLLLMGVTSERKSRLGLSEDENLARELIVRHWAQLKYREKELRRTREGMALNKALMHLEARRGELIYRIRQLGGVPKRWQ